MTIETPRGPGNDDALRRIAAQQAQRAREAQLAREQQDMQRQQQAETDRAGVDGGAVDGQTGPLGRQAIDGPAGADLPPVLDPHDPALAHQPQAVKDAVKTLTDLTTGLHGTPAERTAAIARALSQAKPLQEQLGKLKALPPDLQAAVQDEVAQLNQAASPQELTKLLKTQVDFKDLPVEAVADLGRLRVVTDAGLQKELDSLSAEAMSAGAINAASMTAHPELGLLIAPLQGSDNKQLKQQLHDTLRFVSDGLLSKRFAGADRHNKDDLKRRFKDAAADMADLAQKSGTGPVFQQAFKDSAGGNELAKIANHKHKSFLDKVGDAVGDVVGDVVGGVADLGKGFVNVARDVANVTLHGLGDVVDLGAHAAGNVFKFEADALAAGFDAVGAHGAAKASRAVGDKLDDTLDTVGDTGKFVLDTAGTLIGEGPMAAVNDIADKVIGPERPEFKGQVDGVTGAISNRLGVGDSVFMKLEVSGELSFGEQLGAEVNGAGAKEGAAAFVGAKLSGGATLGRNPDGTLSLTLEMSAKATAGVKAEEKVALTDKNKADLEAKADVEATGRGKMVLKFDPTKPEDVKRLKALTEPTPAKIAAAIVNPLAAAAITGPALLDAIKHNLASTELGLDVGVEVSAKAEAVFGGKNMVRAGLDASAIAGEKQKKNVDGTTETTTFIKAGATASVVAANFKSKLGARETFGASGAASVMVKTDQAGNIIGISGEEDAQVGFGASGAERRGVDKLRGDALKDAKQGDVTGTQKFAGLNTNDIQTVTHTLTPQALAIAKGRIDQGEPALAVFMDLEGQPGMSTASRLTVKTSDFSVGFQADIKVLAGLQVGAKFTVGKSHATFEQLDPPPSSLVQDMSQDGTPLSNRH
ncbi:MAG: hypothetical protein JWM80_1528 [Cyanobacteria bacterium RYN_339]|nr:hypothetical protein [Cyanobacteria bacterium RYN_339]